MRPVGSSHFTRVILHAYIKPSKSAISRPIFEGTCYGLDRLPTLPRSSSIRQPTLFEALPLRREEIPDQPRRDHPFGVISGRLLITFWRPLGVGVIPLQKSPAG